MDLQMEKKTSNRENIIARFFSPHMFFTVLQGKLITVTSNTNILRAMELMIGNGAFTW